ncbi:MAG TPA: PKD domain-containing protein [Candidatus Thermoplasmatota archaeon]|nr:PKD domain-containing protein [Candidatus Thermoplasmatota archaeon]
MGRPPLEVVLLALLAASLAAAMPPAQAAVVPTAPGAADMAAAIDDAQGLLTGAAFEHLADARAVGIGNGLSGSMAGFPTTGSDFAILTTGDARDADDPNTSSGTSTMWGNDLRGAFDATVLRLDFLVPWNADCIALTYRFLSEEYPEYAPPLQADWNDGFVVELDAITWSIDADQNVVAPGQLATGGNPTSVKTTPMSAAAAGGTTYDGAGPLETVVAAVTPGGHSLYLSIFDVGDRILDSAVFVDGFRVGQMQGGECRPVKPPPLLFDYRPHAKTTCEPVTFEVLSPVSYSSPYWDLGDGTTSTADRPVHKYAKSGTYIVYLEVWDEEQKKRVSDTMPVTIGNCPPTARFALGPLDDSRRTVVVADASFDRDSTCIATWDWRFGEEFRTSDPDPEPYRFQTLGYHIVRLQVTDCEGAVSNVATHVFVAHNGAPLLHAVPALAHLVGSHVTFVASAWDPDGDAVTLRALRLPPHASFPPVHGSGVLSQTFSWPTDALSPGHYVVLLVAEEADGESVQAEVRIELYEHTRDADADGVPDSSDTCPGKADREQEGRCRPEVVQAPLRAPGTQEPPPATLPRPAADTDGDGVPDSRDLCPLHPDPDQRDLDGDGLGDACDPDADGDGWLESPADPAAQRDNCPRLPNPLQQDTDGDGIGDGCDPRMPHEARCEEAECLARSRPSVAAHVSEVPQRAYLLGAGVAAGLLLVMLIAELRARRRGPG